MSATYVIDIDGTICDWQAGRDYTLAEPFPERIKEINNCLLYTSPSPRDS